MELNSGSKRQIILQRLKELFVKKDSFSSKAEVKLASFKWLAIVFLLIFIAVVLLLPNEVPVQFIEKIDHGSSKISEQSQDPSEPSRSQDHLWSPPRREFYRSPGGSGSQINYNTAMVVGSGANAKTRLHAGVRMPLRILDKVIVSQDSTPVLAELLLDTETDSGLKLQAGTRFYGEASFAKGSERAAITFKQISLLNGQMKPIKARAVGKDGQAGVAGRVYSDGTRNTAGQVITSFVGGLAGGSVQTDVFGRSQGGIGNGLLTAVAEAAKNKAQSYGENLKAEREWIEIQPDTECDAQLFDSMDLQSGAGGE